MAGEEGLCADPWAGWRPPRFLLEGDLLVGTRHSSQVTAESGPGLLARKEARSHSPC